MLTRETCPKCKGQRYITVRLPQGKADFRKCPECAGIGYKIKQRATC